MGLAGAKPGRRLKQALRRPDTGTAGRAAVPGGLPPSPLAERHHQGGELPGDGRTANADVRIGSIVAVQGGQKKPLAQEAGEPARIEDARAKADIALVHQMEAVPSQ